MSSNFPFTLHNGRLHIVPIQHDRLEFAHEVRRAILAIRPAAVAVELPIALRGMYLEAVRRLPCLSVVVQQNEGVDTPILWYVYPTDPLTEAIRTAEEAEIPVHFVDLNLQMYPPRYERLPDPYVVYNVGLERYFSECRALTPSMLDDEDVRRRMEDAVKGLPAELQAEFAEWKRQGFPNADDMRERHMAYWMDRLLAENDRGEVMLVCGMAHAESIARHVAQSSGRVGQHAAISSLVLSNPDLEFTRATSSEIPFLMATYEFDRKGPGPDSAWEATKEAPPPPEEPRPLDELTEGEVVGALETLLGIRPKTPEKRVVLTPDVMRALSKKLRGMRDPRAVLDLLGGNQNRIPHVQGVPSASPEQHRIFKFKTVEERRPELRGIYAQAATLRSPSSRMLDRQRVLVRLVRTAARFYEENTGETFKPWQLRTMLQFIRSYARVKGLLLPNQWPDLAVAARGVSEDNYAYEVWDLASFYPWTDEGGRYPSLSLDGDLVNLQNLRKFPIRRRFPRFRERFMKPPVRPRKKEEKPGEWASDFEHGTICSYPPEDVVIEEYGRYLKKKALLVLSEERTRTEPFTTSLLDGIDVRETIRNWPTGGRPPASATAAGGRATERAGAHRIYVREIQKVKGGAGSVVVIFDEDTDDSGYPWRMTWHGEHEQESDMAFYSTPVYGKIVGPGIARCEYGGIMLTYPPRRVMDVWSDPFYHEAQTKAEVLLLAGLEYSQEKHVVYVAAQPPRSIFRTRANQLGRKIVYLPIGQLSPVSIKKLRVFHVLSRHHVREFAKDYIW